MNENKKRKTDSKKTLKKLNVEEQISAYLEKGYQNRLSEIVGKWPGDESIEEILRDINN